MGKGNKAMNDKMDISEAGLREVSRRIEDIARERPSHKEVLEFLKEVTRHLV